MRKFLSCLIFLLSGSLATVQADSLKVLNKSFPGSNLVKLKIIDRTSYSLNLVPAKKNAYTINIYSFNYLTNFYDSLLIKGSSPLIAGKLLLDYYVRQGKLYLLADKKIVVYNLKQGKLIDAIELKNDMNVIQEVTDEKIFMSLNFLFHPQDVPCSYAISYYDLAAKSHMVNELCEFSSLPLLAANPYSISFKNGSFFVNALDDYKVVIYDKNLVKTGEIINPEAFGNMMKYHYTMLDMLSSSKKDIIHRIVEEDDFKYPRMIGVQALSMDSLIVLYKLPTDSGNKKSNIILDLWINDGETWARKFTCEPENGAYHEGGSPADFFQFKSQFVVANTYVKTSLHCDDKQEKPCTCYSMYFHPREKFGWRKIE